MINKRTLLYIFASLLFVFGAVAWWCQLAKMDVRIAQYAAEMRKPAEQRKPLEPAAERGGFINNTMDSVYYSFQMFTGGFPNDALKVDAEPVPTHLILLRLVAYSLTILFALLALFEPFRAWMFALWRWIRITEFDIVIGYGAAGSGIATALNRRTDRRRIARDGPPDDGSPEDSAALADQRRRRVVVLTRSLTSLQRREAREAGIELYQGDVYEGGRVDRLPFAPLRKAHRIYIAAGNDTDTLAITDSIMKRLETQHDRIWMHIENRLLLERLRDNATLHRQPKQRWWLVRLLSRLYSWLRSWFWSPKAAEVEQRWMPQAFSLAEATAEYLTARYKPMLTAQACGQTRLHAVIIGFDRCTWRTAEQLVLNGTFPPPTFTRPRITVIDRAGELAEKQWLARHPRLARWADISFIKHDPDTVSWSEDDPLLARVETLDPPSLFVFAQRENALAQALALRHGMEKGFRQPARAFVVSTSYRENTLDFGQIGVDLQDDVILVGDAARVAAVSVSLNGDMVSLAKAFHGIYGGIPPFRELSETLRISNRRAALHSLDKLAILGFEALDPREPSFGMSKAAADLLAKIVPPQASKQRSPIIDQIAGFEHVRWCIDRTIDGWSTGPRDDEARKREQLEFGHYGYDELGEEEKSKDVDQLAALSRWMNRHALVDGGIRPARILDDPAIALPARWQVEDGTLRLELASPVDWERLFPASPDEVQRIRILIPPELPRGPQEGANHRAAARRDAYAAFAEQLTAAGKGRLRFRLLRARAEGWNWLGKVAAGHVGEQAGDGKEVIVDGATLPPLTIGFAGPRRLGDYGPEDQVRNVLGRRLAAIVEEYGATGRPLRLVTGMAIGADALMIGICRPFMPILGIGTGDHEEGPQRVNVTVSEPVSNTETGDDRYVAVAQRIIDSCEVLVAMHDGSDGNGPGGTADTIARATRLGRKTHIVSPVIAP